MALPGVSLPLLSILLVAVELLGAPSNAARAALLPEVFPDDRYVVASAVGNITGQCAQVLGFAAGGALAALLGPSRTLLVDAATFLASAAVGRRRPRAPGSPVGGRPVGRGDPVAVGLFSGRDASGRR
jgi:MFS family permease